MSGSRNGQACLGIKMKTDISIIIVSFNTKDLIVNCINSIVKHTKNINYEIVVVDNNSTDGSPEMLKKLKLKNMSIVVSKTNLGFTGGNNLGIKKAKGKYILFLNSDTLLESNVIGEMCGWMDNHPKIGISTCSLIGRDGKLQRTGGYFPNLINVFSWMTIQDIPGVDIVIKPFHPNINFYREATSSTYRKEQEIDWVTGAFLLVRSEVVIEIGVLDESYFMYGEDVDFCYRTKGKGWKVMYLPKWTIIHYGGASSTREFPILSEFKGIKIFFKKYKPNWQYPLLRLILKIGSLGRAMLFGIIEGKESASIYAKAFKTI